MRNQNVKLNSIKVSLKLPFIGELGGTWEPDESERSAAWEMYVELVTRVAVVELGPQEGLLREALSSLYSLFDVTRKILRSYGPGVAQPKGEDNLSFGYLAVVILNTVLRPLLAKWHPLLLDYESECPNTVSALDHQHAWERNDELRRALNETRTIMINYANLLAEVAAVPSLMIPQTEL